MRPVRTTHSRAWSQHDGLTAVDAASWSRAKAIQACRRLLSEIAPEDFGHRGVSPCRWRALLGRSKVWPSSSSWVSYSSEG